VGKKVTKEFKEKVIDIAKRLGTKPDYLMAIMAFETGGTFDPAQQNHANPVHGPVGLIQFTGRGAESVGTTKEALLKMSDIEQLDYVEEFLNKKKYMGLSKLEDLYAAVHWPAATGRKDDYVLYSKQEGKAGKNYRSNAPLDANKDGKVTLKEAAAMVRAKLDEGEAYRG
jgi:hypothetical protein